MKRPSMMVSAALLIGLGLSGFAASHAFASSNPEWHASGYGGPWGGRGFGGMMGNGGQSGWGSEMGSMMGEVQVQVDTVKPAVADREMKSSLKNAVVNRNTRTISYPGKSIKIVAFGGAMDDSSAGPEEKFVIGGLVNPTIHVKQGATVTFELVNEDTDMPHGIEVTSAQPPYWGMSMMQGGLYPGTFIYPIPAATKSAYPVASTTFTAEQPGDFHYICQYPNHAAEGMYGKFIVG